jgi:acetoin utilization deacetylase AcuC-like enzyme
MIVDWDVHHGNGTQEIFWKDSRVLYLSSHLYPFYPGTGGVDEVGAGAGRGFTVNLPLPPGTGDAEYGRLYREIVEPIGRAFRPDLVIVSAGFDPYRWDPLASMDVTAAGFGALAASCVRIAAETAGGRAVFALEGGYDLDGLASGAAAVTGVLLGESVEETAPEPGPGAPVFERVLPALRRVHSQFWPGLE